MFKKISYVFKNSFRGSFFWIGFNRFEKCWMALTSFKSFLIVSRTEWIVSQLCAGSADCPTIQAIQLGWQVWPALALHVPVNGEVFPPQLSHLVVRVSVEANLLQKGSLHFLSFGDAIAVTKWNLVDVRLKSWLWRTLWSVLIFLIRSRIDLGTLVDHPGQLLVNFHKQQHNPAIFVYRLLETLFATVFNQY